MTVSGRTEKDRLIEALGLVTSNLHACIHIHIDIRYISIHTNIYMQVYNGFEPYGRHMWARDGCKTRCISPCARHMPTFDGVLV